MQDDLFIYIANFIVASMIKPSHKYLGRKLTKRVVKN